jgi:formate hydrogenlyase subunit 3/multisubunit Na+/H+ antiporter MnhD subunit
MTDTSLLVLLPFLAALAATIHARGAAGWGLAGTVASAGLAAHLALSVHASGPASIAIGGWAAPLGITLRADGLAALMIAMTALVGLGVCVQALAAWGLRPTAVEDPRRARMRMGFWPLWLSTLAALNGLYLSGDLFNLYVTFEILGLAAVGLTALSGTRRALRAAFDYLVAGLAGSLLLLLGVALAYAAAGRVDLGVLPLLADSAAGRIAIALIVSGVGLKAALFPLHFWMPAAHSSAAPAASAILSALVVKGALYLALRLLLEGGLAADALRWGLICLGAGGMAWGSVCALRADRLKLLVAYSTVAQIGLIMLAISVAGDPLTGTAWQAAALLMLSHALAKAAMFLAVGRIAEELGHDRISGLNRSDLRPGAAEFAFAIAAISLIGLPPTAGFVGKWVLIDGLIGQGAWPVVALVLTGTVLSVAYLSRVVSRCLRGGPHIAPGARRPPWRAGDVAAIGLAFTALFMGLLSAAPLALLNGPLLS